MARGPPPPPRPRPGRGSPSYSRTSSVTPQPSGAAPTPSEPAPPPELPGVEAGSSGPLVRARAACDTAPGADAVRQRTDGGSGRKGRGEAALTRALLAPRAAHAWPAHRMSALTPSQRGEVSPCPFQPNADGAHMNAPAALACHRRHLPLAATWAVPLWPAAYAAGAFLPTAVPGGGRFRRGGACASGGLGKPLTTKPSGSRGGVWAQSAAF